MKHLDKETELTADDSPATTTDHHNLERARRRLILATGGTIALSAVSSGWRSPIVESVVLPAHAQTTDSTNASSQRWAYDNSSAAFATPVGGFETASGSSACGSISGPAVHNGNYVIFGCAGNFAIASWFINGVDVVGAPVPFNGGVPPNECAQIMQNMAAAMNTVDPNAPWEQALDPVPPGQGGCGLYVRSQGVPDNIVYGTMIVEDSTDDREWILNPVIA